MGGGGLLEHPHWRLEGCRWPDRMHQHLSAGDYVVVDLCFGWAFGDLMRDIPTICTPDGHDVYHGNLWGEGGVPFDDQDIINRRNNINTSDLRGFAQTVRFVNMVNRTQCNHLPDPYDPTPIEQGMSVWYTSLNYGRVNFAIVSDRIFKSARERVSQWEGRHDHISEPLDDPSIIEQPTLHVTGDANPIVEVISEVKGETVYMVRIKGNMFMPRVFDNGLFSVRIGYPEMDTWQVFEGMQAYSEKEAATLEVTF